VRVTGHRFLPNGDCEVEVAEEKRKATAIIKKDILASGQAVRVVGATLAAVEEARLLLGQ
jgi:hypothetical protein